MSIASYLAGLFRKRPEQGVSYPACAPKVRESRPGDDPAELAIWADPSAHGVLPIQFIRNELMRQLAEAIRDARHAADNGAGQSYRDYMSSHVNGQCFALRLMGNEGWVNFDEAWADKVHAELGTPMSEPYGWPDYPGEVLSHERAKAVGVQP